MINRNKNLLFIILALVILGGGGWWYWSQGDNGSDEISPAIERYACEEGKAFSAEIRNGAATVTLDAGRVFQMPNRNVPTEGVAIFRDSEEKFAFLRADTVEHKSSFVFTEEKATTAYKGCTRDSNQ